MPHLVFFFMRQKLSCRVSHVDSCLTTLVFFFSQNFVQMLTDTWYGLRLLPLKGTDVEFDTTSCKLMVLKNPDILIRVQVTLGSRGYYCHLCCRVQFSLWESNSVQHHKVKGKKNPSSFQCLLHLMTSDCLKMQTAFGQVLNLQRLQLW